MGSTMPGAASNRPTLKGVTPASPRTEAKTAVTRPRGRPKKRDTFTVSFRLDELRVKELEKSAGEFGLSVHEYARVLVCQALDSAGEAQVLEELDGVRGDVRALRDELLNGVTLLLTNMVEEERPGSVRAAVEKVLRGSGKGA